MNQTSTQTPIVLEPRSMGLIAAGFIASGLLWPLGWITSMWDLHVFAVLLLSIFSGSASLITLSHRYRSAPSMVRFYAQTGFWMYVLSACALFVVAVLFRDFAQTTSAAFSQWALYVPRFILSLVLLITGVLLRNDERDLGMENRAYVGWIWVGTAATVFVFVVFSIFLSLPAGISFAPFYHLEELLLLLVFLVGLYCALKYGKWVSQLYDYGLVWLLILECIACTFFLFAPSLGSSFGIAGILIHTIALFVPFIAIELEMFRLFRFSEQYRRKALRPHFGTKEAHTKLEAEVFRKSVEQSHDALYITNANGEVVFANRGFLDTTGYQMRDVYGRTPDAWTHRTEGQESYAHIFATIKLRKESFTGMIWHRRESGLLYEARVHISPIINEFGDVAWFVVREHDLTEGREQTLFMQQMLDNMPLGVCLVETPTTKVVLSNNYANTLLRTIGGKNPEQFSDLIEKFCMSSRESYPVDKLPFIETIKTQEAAEKDDIELCGYRDQEGEGDAIIWKMHSTPLFDAQGKMKHVLIAFDDITRQKQQEHKMTDAISVASHQLRTPLTGIKWAIEELQRGEEFGASKEEKIEIFSTLHDATVRMFNVVQGLLDVSKLEQGQIEIKPEPLKLNELINTVFKEFAPRIEEKKLIVKKTMLHTIPVAEFDAILVRQVIQNLIDNAVKYTEENGEIDSVLSIEKNMIQWSLHDTGIGIAKEDLDHLFNKFHRGDNAQRLDAYGMGLGLYTVKFIVDLLDCEVRCESEIDRGTTFRITFPLKKSGEVHKVDSVSPL
jgi:PAS domain S-box-containing protein